MNGDRGAIARLQHNRVTLALHEVTGPSAGDDSGSGRNGENDRAAVHPLLLLHGLGERTPHTLPDYVDWPGAAVGLDFTGHGDSTVPIGGGYTSEILVGDVDAALCHLDERVTILGRGLGAYIGLLCAAARPDVVHGVVMTDGPGLAGGGVHPGSRALVSPAESVGPPDPYAMMELARDVRPADYARTFAGIAVERSELDVPLWVSAVVRPAWVEAIMEVPGVGRGSVQRGLATYLR